MTLSQDPPSVAKVRKSLNLTEVMTRPLSTVKDSPIFLPGTDCQIRSQVPFSTLTSYRVGGPAEWYVAPRCLKDFQASIHWAKAEGLPITIVGAGSNLLVSDRGLSGLAICTRHLRFTEFNDELGQVTVSSGDPIARLAWQVAERGWRGLEWAVGIPGTVGGAVVMNAGAHGSCIADLLINTAVLLPDGSSKILTLEDLNYSYRTSSLQNRDWLVTSATFQLKKGFVPAEVVASTSADLSQRRASQPYHLPSCGSVFRNPEPYKAARLIDQLGLKGYQIGGAQVSELHANFILNTGRATATDVYQLIRHVQQKVEQKYHLHLIPEVKILGHFA